jgi:hypothetical protein
MENVSQNRTILELKPFLLQSILMNLTINQNKDITVHSKNKTLSKSSLSVLK